MSDIHDDASIVKDGLSNQLAGSSKASPTTPNEPMDSSKEKPSLGDPSTHAYRGSQPGRRLMKFTYPSNSKPLDGYTIKRGIGIGGFGEVYFALSDAGKEVALKRIQRNLDVELRGVKQCLNLKHVNLIALWDIRTNDFGESWVVMEYVPGPSLRDVLRENPDGLPEDAIKRWFMSTASGVSYLHDQGIVHRDLKPGNIFHDDDQNVIKIGDYGLSKFISCGRRSGQTESVGTFHYMAPEIGNGSYGKEIDVYAMGIILFELVTGNVPFCGESSQEIIMKHLTATPNVDHVPAGYRDVIIKALAKDPEVRYNNVPEMLADMPWPEVAAEFATNKDAIGPIASNGSNPTNPTNGLASKSDEIIDAEISNDNRTGARLRPLISNGKAEIVFGPLTDTNAGRRPESGGVSNPDRPVHGYTQGPRQAADGPDPIQVINAEKVLPGASTVPGTPPEMDEPIAKAVQTGWSSAATWWNHANLSAPVRVGLLIVAAIVVVQNSQWLLPIAVLLGLAYFIYYVARTWNGTGEQAEAAAERRASRREAEHRTKTTVRQWLGQRDWGDRVAELVGSLLVAAISCGVFNLLGMAITGSIFNATIQSWSLFTWLTLTSILASWGLLICSKAWEHNEGDRWQRQFVMLIIGLGIGGATYAMGQAFTVDVTTFASSEANPLSTSRFSLVGLPAIASYLIFFMVLFGVLRWWHQSDPGRRTRLSIWSVGICLVWAALLSHVLNFAPLWSCVLAAVVAVSVQLAAPWLHPDQRRRICTRSVRP